MALVRMNFVNHFTYSQSRSNKILRVFLFSFLGVLGEKRRLCSLKNMIYTRTKRKRVSVAS